MRFRQVFFFRNKACTSRAALICKKKKKKEKIKPFNHQLGRKTNESVLYKLNSNYKRSQNAKFS